MKGSHSVDGYLNWLRYSKVPAATKLRLSHEIRQKADLCSATGGQALIKFTQPAEKGVHEVAAIRIFDDGSLEIGIPDDAKWYGTKRPPFVPPPEDQL